MMRASLTCRTPAVPRASSRLPPGCRQHRFPPAQGPRKKLTVWSVSLYHRGRRKHQPDVAPAPQGGVGWGEAMGRPKTSPGPTASPSAPGRGPWRSAAPMGPRSRSSSKIPGWTSATAWSPTPAVSASSSQPWRRRQRNRGGRGHPRPMRRRRATARGAARSSTTNALAATTPCTPVPRDSITRRRIDNGIP